MKRISNTVFIALMLSVIFVPEVKATMQQGLMKLGLFAPDLDANVLVANNDTTAVEKDTATYTMSLNDVSGKTVTLEELKGKVVFINFWATWCAPCIAEMPSIQKLFDKFSDRGDIAFVILEAEGNKDKAERFMSKKNLSLPVYYPNGGIPQEFFRGRLPTTVVLDKQGNIAHVTEGMADYSGQDIVDFLNQVAEMHP